MNLFSGNAKWIIILYCCNASRFIYLLRDHLKKRGEMGALTKLYTALMFFLSFPRTRSVPFAGNFGAEGAEFGVLHAAEGGG